MIRDDAVTSESKGHDITSRTSWIAFAISLPLLLVANGRHPVPIAPWLAMLGLLVFVRGRRKRSGLPLAWLALFLGAAFQFRGMAPLPGVFYFVLWAVYGFAMVLPFWIDRLATSRLGGVTGTLVFPCAWVAMEWLVATFTPYGSWNALGYTQYESLVLIQLVAVTGIYGLGFLIAWFASCGALVLSRGAGDGSARRGMLALASVLVLVLAGGGARLVLFAPDAPTVRIASLSGPDLDLFEGVEGGAGAAIGGEITAAGLAALRDNAEAILDDLLERADREVQAGAEIVFWGETNSFSLKEDEPAMLARGASFARERGIHLGMAPAVFAAGRELPLENKIVFIDPRGETLFENWKAIPVPGGDAAIQAVDEGLLEVVDTPHGRIGSAICFDMDFPGLLRQAGDGGADIMLVPSNDWREIDPWHTHMARFRAVEQGFNLVRHTSHGLSVATDHQGRVLASMDHYTTADRALVAHVPTRGARTVYARVGDLFAWLCMGGTMLATVAALRRRSGRGF